MISVANYNSHAITPKLPFFSPYELRIFDLSHFLHDN